MRRKMSGIYAIKPSLPAIGGNEGVWEVVEVGGNVKHLRSGDHVIPRGAGFGTWRTYAVCAEDKLWQVSSDLPLEAAASMIVNPPTAFRIVHDFAELRKGDTIVQNGANSSVGIYVVQIARLLGLTSVNIVRNRPHIDQLRNELALYGADFVLTEEEFKGAEGKKIWKEVSAPKLALNCVGGRSTLYLAAALGENATMVTYGGMSKQPLMVPAGPLIFKNIKLAGFWMSKWYTFPEHEESRQKMFKQLTDWFIGQQLKVSPFVRVRLSDYKDVLTKAVEGSGAKYLFVFD